MSPDNALDYWFRDETGIEVIYNTPMRSWSEDDYRLYVAFYRTEIYDVNKDLRIALGNPIWNDQ